MLKVTQITTASMQGTIFESSRYILVWNQKYFAQALRGGVVRASHWLSKGRWFKPQLSYLTIQSVIAPADNPEKSHKITTASMQETIFESSRDILGWNQSYFLNLQ